MQFGRHEACLIVLNIDASIQLAAFMTLLRSVEHSNEPRTKIAAGQAWYKVILESLKTIKRATDLRVYLSY